MRLNNITIKILLVALFFMLIPNTLSAEYSNERSYTTSGSNSYGVNSLLRLDASISGSYLTLKMSKNGGGSFSTSGNVYIKVGSPEVYGFNRQTGKIYSGNSSKSFRHNLDSYSGYPKKFYARYQSDNGGWAWVGPITISYIEPSDTTKPTGSITGLMNITQGNRLSTRISANDNKALSKMTLHIQKVGGSVVLSKSWSSSSNSFSQNYTIYTSNWSEGTYNYSYFIKDANENLETITGSFKVSEDKDTTDPTGRITTTIKGSYEKGTKISFGVRANDNKKLKTITLNISKSTDGVPIASISKSWSSTSTFFNTTHTVDTKLLEIGTYNYALWVKDNANNTLVVQEGDFSVTLDTVTPPPPIIIDPLLPPTTNTELSKTLGVRYEQPICFNTIAPTVNIKTLNESEITHNGVKSLAIELEADVSGGTRACTDSRNVFHTQHLFVAWKTDKGGFLDITGNSSEVEYNRVKFIIPSTEKHEYQIRLYVGDNLGKEVRKSMTKSNGKDTDGDGTADVYDWDDDNDGLTDYQESKYSFLNPLVADAQSDYDNDGISNMDEINEYRTDPSKKDTDGDGVDDKEDKYPNDATKFDDEKVGNKWIALKSKTIFSVKEEELESTTIANFVIVSYNPKPTRPQAFTIYMQDEKGVKSIIKTGQVTLDQERWLEVKLPVGTKKGVYKIWGSVEVDSKESNIQDNTSKTATITVIEQKIKPKALNLFSVPLYTTSNVLTLYIVGYEAGILVVNGKETDISVKDGIKKIELDANEKEYNLQVKVGELLSQAVNFKVYNNLNITLQEQMLALKARGGRHIGKYVCYYRFDIDRERLLTIEMQAGFDTHLSIVDLKGNPLYQDINRGYSTNSRLQNITLKAGSYYIETVAYQKDVKGQFSLKIQEAVNNQRSIRQYLKPLNTNEIEIHPITLKTQDNIKLTEDEEYRLPISLKHHEKQNLDVLLSVSDNSLVTLTPSWDMYEPISSEQYEEQNLTVNIKGVSHGETNLSIIASDENNDEQAKQVSISVIAEE